MRSFEQLPVGACCSCQRPKGSWMLYTRSAGPRPTGSLIVLLDFMTTCLLYMRQQSSDGSWISSLEMSKCSSLRTVRKVILCRYANIEQLYGLSIPLLFFIVPFQIPICLIFYQFLVILCLKPSPGFPVPSHPDLFQMAP